MKMKIKIDIKKLSEEVFNAIECVDKEDQKGFFKSVDKIAELQDGADKQTVIFFIVKAIYHYDQALEVAKKYSPKGSSNDEH